MSRAGNTEGGREGARGGKSEENEGNRKRQEKTEGIRGPAATPEKSSLRQGLTHRTLHRGAANSASMSEPADSRPHAVSVSSSPDFSNSRSVSGVQQILRIKQQSTLFHMEDSENTDHAQFAKSLETQHISVMNSSRVHMRLVSHIYPALSPVLRSHL